MALYPQIHLLYNPAAGRLQRSSGALLARLIETLGALGSAVTQHPTAAPGDATRHARLAAESGADLIVVAGGDGTINEAVNGMVGCQVPMAVLPLGTANILANEMGVHRSPAEAARIIPDLYPYRISLGLLKSTGAAPRHFLCVAGAGLDAQIVVDVDPNLKKHIGRLAYWIGGFGQLGRKFPQFRVKVNGDEFQSSFTLAARARNYGGDLEIARTASLLEDYFEMVAFEGEDSFRYVGYLTGVLANWLDRMEGVTIRRATHLEFTPEGDEPIPVQVDGELCGHLPATVEIVPDALTILMPVTIRERYTRGSDPALLS